MMTIRTLVFCLFLLLCICSQAFCSEYRLDFTGEELTFSLGSKLWQLDGDYLFSNYSPEEIKQTIYFPIPTDTTAMPAHDVSIKVIKPLKGQICKMLSVTPKGFWFELTLPAQTIAVCKIKYKQRLLGKRANYILLTANSWGKPLEYAKYTLNVPNKIEIVSMSLDEPIVRKGLFLHQYQWDYINYAPDKDFIVEFK